MIFFQRRRFFFWLIKAYFKSHKKTIVVSFILGLVIFYSLIFGANFVKKIIPIGHTETVGVSGSYTTNTLPVSILYRASRGLTYLEENGNPKPDLAENWTIENEGKTYIFKLKKGIYFTDKKEFTSDAVNYNFIDVTEEKPDKYTIIFKLKDKYSPFLTTVSKPIFRNEFIGIGPYEIKNIDLNGDFINSLSLEPKNNTDNKINYKFYPTQNSLKSSLVLGETNKIIGVSDLSYKDSDLSLFSNLKIEKNTNYNSLTTLFYNTKDSVLSDKRLRQALSYSIPNSFKEGQRNYGPYPKTLWADNSAGQTTYQQDFEHAKLLLSESSASNSAKLVLEIKTLPKYKNVALDIAKSWKTIGINTNIEIVESLPTFFQVFLGEFTVPRDPDQYIIWHSNQANNITGYKNLRIDKLLEDGRQIVEQNDRKKIYASFQKYLLDDSPAAFLFFPYSYSVSKK